MNFFKNGARDARDAGIDEILAGLKLRRMNGNAARYALTALAVAGAAAVGWGVGLFSPPAAAARKLQRRVRMRLGAGRGSSHKVARAPAH
jgi:hypothetical protein